MLDTEIPKKILDTEIPKKYWILKPLKKIAGGHFERARPPLHELMFIISLFVERKGVTDK